VALRFEGFRVKLRQNFQSTCFFSGRRAG